MFSVEDLEWEYHESTGNTHRLEFSNGNRNLKNVSCKNCKKCRLHVDIKLKNKNVNSDRQYSITIKNEIKDDDYLIIGVIDFRWKKSICYYHRDETKKLETKVKCGDILVIKDKCVAKLNAKNRVYLVSMFINGKEAFASYYSQEQRRELYLNTNSIIKLEVDVKGKIITKKYGELN